ncbi:MAG: winged helix-turn-helix domain-containing protein, partial [Candidatus Acidiferrales bacterium]
AHRRGIVGSADHFTQLLERAGRAEYPTRVQEVQFLLHAQHEIVGVRRLLQAVWGPDYGNETEYLRVFINQLRKKIEPDPAHPKYIHTDPWVGYRFEPSGSAPAKPKKK